MSNRKTILALVCFIEMLFFTLIIFGFNSLTSAYKSLGVFSQFCNSSNKKSNQTSIIICQEQDVIYGNVFIIWVSFQALSAMPGGLLFDKFGIKLTKLTAALINTLAFILFGIIQFNSWLLILAGCLSAFSGFILCLSNFSIAGTYYENKNLIISIQGGLMGSSLLVFNIIQLLFDRGIAIYISFSTLAFLSLLITVGGITLIPNPKPITIIDEISDEINENNCKTKLIPEDVILQISYQRQQYLLDTFPTISKAFVSREYIFYLISYSLIFYRNNFFLSQLASQLNFVFQGNKHIVNHLQFYSNIFLSLTLFISVFAGLLLDNKLKKTNKIIESLFSMEFPYRNFNLYNKIYVAPFLICISSIFLASFLIGTADKFTYYFIFTLFCIGRSFNTCLLGSYIVSVFPKRYFGTLSAATIMFSGIFNLTQIPLNKLAASDRYPSAINYALIGCPFIALLHPLYLYLK